MHGYKIKCRPNPTRQNLAKIRLSQFFPQLLRKQSTSIHAEIHGGSQRHKRRRILRAAHVLHADFHLRPTTASHRRRHHKPSVQ